MQRRCNCSPQSNATDCTASYPSPLAGCTKPKWRVSCYAYGMKGVVWGSGQHGYSDGGCLDCFKGQCVLSTFNEGWVDAPDAYAEGQCIDANTISDMCAKYAQGAAVQPSYDGYHVIDFTDVPLEGSNVVYDDQSDVTYITSVVRCRDFDGCANSGQTGKFTTVTVSFEFTHTFNGWNYEPDPITGNCEYTRYPSTFNQTWTAIYQRRLLTTEYLASGNYVLVRVIPPIGGDSGTIYAGCLTSPCPFPYRVFPLEYCAPSYLADVDYQGNTFPWTPPKTLSLTRIC